MASNDFFEDTGVSLAPLRPRHDSDLRMSHTSFDTLTVSSNDLRAWGSPNIQRATPQDNGILGRIMDRGYHEFWYQGRMNARDFYTADPIRQPIRLVLERDSFDNHSMTLRCLSCGQTLMVIPISTFLQHTERQLTFLLEDISDDHYDRGCCTPPPKRKVKEEAKKAPSVPRRLIRE